MADNTTNVVQLNSHNAMQGDVVSDSHLFARLPAPFTEMKEKGKQALQPLLQALFDNIDDALFELADLAEHNSQQNMYFESMRELRIKRRGMELNFGKELDNAFHQLLASTDMPPTLTSADEVTVDTLSLIADDQLEELVAVDSMVAKAERQFPQPLKQLTIRLDSLVDQCSVTIKNNPYGPATICYSFIAVCKNLDLDIKAKLVLFKLFDRYVMSALDSVYRVCNDVLIAGGILAKLDQRRGQAVQGADDVSAKQSGSSADTEQSSKVFTDLQTLLHQLPASTHNGQNGLVGPGQAPQLPRDTLMQLLQAVHNSLAPQMQQQQQAALQGVGPQQLDIQQALSGLLSAKMPTRSVSIGQIDDDSINLVAMLFQFILDDRNLAAPMKALIARLQIPIIKVAVLDKSFFSKGGHPARKLLNEIANASLGWVQVNNIERDPLYSQVSTVVNRITHEFDGDTQLFHEVLSDFVEFLELDRRRIGLIEQRTINAEDGKAKSELARETVQTVLNERVVGKPLPKVVVTLLEQAWSNVLFLIFLKEGKAHKSWHDALQVVDDLLWSVQPMADVDSRQQLIAIMPKLLNNLRAGLTKIGYDPFEMNQIFADLESIHLTQMKGLSSVKLDVTAEIEAEVSAVETIPAGVDLAAEHNDAQPEQQCLDDEGALERLDAELDQQLAGFDALAALVSQSADAAVSEEYIPSVEPTVLAAVAKKPLEDDKLVRRVVEKLVVNGASKELDNTGTDLPVDHPALTRVDAMAMGNWVELYQEDGKKFRCRLAAIIRSTGKYIFVNRSGMKVAKYNRMSLGVAIDQGRVKALDEGQLFDRALESVIGNLRKMKTTS